MQGDDVEHDEVEKMRWRVMMSTGRKRTDP